MARRASDLPAEDIGEVHYLPPKRRRDSVHREVVACANIESRQPRQLQRVEAIKVDRAPMGDGGVDRKSAPGGRAILRIEPHGP